MWHLPVDPSKSDLKLHNISVTPKMVKKVIMNLNLSKESGPDCESERSNILAGLFNNYLKESCLEGFIIDTGI